MSSHSFIRHLVIVFVTLLLVLDLLATAPVTADARRHHNHGKKVSRAAPEQSRQEYEYRDTTEYDGGVAIDSVPMKTNYYDTPTPPAKEHHFSNRFAAHKLRKFFADAQRYYQRK